MSQSSVQERYAIVTAYMVEVSDATSLSMSLDLFKQASSQTKR